MKNKVTKMKKVEFSLSDFKELIESNCYYVDKSMFIHELLNNNPRSVTIIPRPRRFGKTLNMTMLKYFFEKPLDGVSNVHLFDGLAITQYPEIMARQGKSPVIFITFKGIKDSTWQGCYEKIIDIIASEYKRFNGILNKTFTEQDEQDIFNAIKSQKATQVQYENALKFLSMHVHRICGTRPIILIDEYDAPMQSGFESEYYEEIKNFMYSFFCAGLKDNNNLEFAVITGILRVAKESIFSGMNNSVSYSLLNDTYADKFGFLQSEVDTMLEYFNVPIPRDEIKHWYNGYRVGRPKHDAQGNEYFTTIYNPWAIIECVKTKGLGNFWVNTGGNFLIKETMRHANATDKQDLIAILQGQPVTKTINDAIVFRDIYRDSSSMWSFLVFTGHLTWNTRNDRLGETVAQLILPNYEVRSSIKKMIAGWFIDERFKRKDQFEQMVSGIQNGIPELFLQMFNNNVLASMSYFDLGADGESVYQAFTLGILVSLADTHEVTTNRESGTGRYDLCIIPHDPTQPGTIIEFKRRLFITQGPLATFAQEALDQIKTKKYTTVMKARGIKTIAKIGIAFERKLMAWNFELCEGDAVVEKGSYSAERAVKRLVKRVRRTPGKK